MADKVIKFREWEITKIMLINDDNHKKPHMKHNGILCIQNTEGLGKVFGYVVWDWLVRNWKTM